MKDVLSRLAELRRPNLLMTAARIAAEDHRREAALRRFFGLETPRGTGEALTRLIEIEAWFDERRRSGDAGYSAVRHVEVMAAILGESRILRQARNEAAEFRSMPVADSLAAAAEAPTIFNHQSDRTGADTGSGPAAGAV